MNEISTAGWIAIIVIGLLLIGTNLSLIAALRKGSQKPSPPQFLDSWKVLKRPWIEEERQWGELADKVKQLDEKSKDDIQ